MEKKRIYERIECLKKSSTSLLFELKGGLVIMEDRNRSFSQLTIVKRLTMLQKMNRTLIPKMTILR